MTAAKYIITFERVVPWKPMKSPVSAAVASSLIDLKLIMWLQGFYLTSCNDY